ncbi:MAG TPA: TolC family protein [Chitinophagaceae bacterium]|jgi:outer membrane protein TolC
MKRIFASIISTYLLCQIASAQAMKLEDILDSIQQAYPSLKVYDATIQSLEAAAKGARNWMPPEISTGLWMVPYNTNLWKANGTGTTGMGQYMISAQQMFPNKKYNDANEAYMEGMSSVEKENKQATLNELFAAVKKNYYEWIMIEKKLAVLSQDEKLLQFMITNAETRYKNGLGKISAYYKAKASLGDIENMRVELENDVIQRRIALNTLMNREKLTAFSIDTNYNLKEYSTLVFDSSFFYTNRSDLKAVDKNVQLIYLQQNIEQASTKPQFGVSYSHMFGFGGSPAQYTLMGMMKVPINWSTRMNKANIESLKWKAESLKDQKASMSNEYSGMAYQIQQNITTKKKQVQLFELNIIPALRKNYESTLLAYEQNTEELFELFDSWKTLNDTQLDYLDQQQQLLMMQVDLEKLLEIK